MNLQLSRPFVDSTQNMILQMAGINTDIITDFYPEKDDLVSYGFSSIVSFAGKIKGRLLLDMEPNLALAFAEMLYDEKYGSAKEKMVLAAISELNNIIAGDANTYLNDQYHLSLRLALPIVFVGQSHPIICIPKIASASVDFTTSYGKLKMNVAFEGGL
jgi:chemotaxis protein CheX